MKFKQTLLVIVLSFASAFASIALYDTFFGKREVIISNPNKTVPLRYAKYINDYGAVSDPMDFTKAASVAVPAVVHIKTKIPAKRIRKSNDDSDDFFNQFFGFGFGPSFIPEQRASGSGVLISDDGYIVTNNHVITDQNGNIAEEINVTLHNGKTYKAKVVGHNETSDVAVLKISGSNFPYMIFGNSDNLQTGQWVLAVGYPLSLETTVTAGIISATGRNIGVGTRHVKDGEVAQRSFIQTDAAVNSGNSGGALINTNGELIGMNTAIMSPTGTYAGYSFAIPVNVLKKAVKEIIQSKDMQRGS